LIPVAVIVPAIAFRGQRNAAEYFSGLRGTYRDKLPERTMISAAG
jgi:hypothetical protein